MNHIKEARELREVALPRLARRKLELIRVLGELEMKEPEYNILFLAATFALSETLAWEAELDLARRN